TCAIAAAARRARHTGAESASPTPHAPLTGRLPLRGQDMQGPEQNVQLTGVEGLVKWFDPRKGFGFVVGPEGQDIFVHFSVIQGEGFRVLKDGSKVNYDAVKSDKGWKATRVSRVDALEVTVAPR